MSRHKQQPYWERHLVEQPLRSGGFTSDIERKVRERIRMGQRNGKSRGWVRAAAALTAFVVLLGGGWLLRDDIGSMLKRQPDKLNGIPAALQNDSLADMNSTLKVMESEYDNFTNMQYARPFLLHHPTVGIETAVMKEQDKLLEWVDKEKPDVLRLRADQYYELIQEGRLQPLDALIANDKVDVDEMHKPIMDLLRAYGGGQLYGLTPSFQTSVIYVNTKLFKENGIPLPHEGMTWDELLETAARFQGTGTAGLAGSPFNSNPMYLVDAIRRSDGLQLHAQGGKQITVDSEAWERLWDRLATGYREGWLYRDTKSDKKSGEVSFTPSDPFLKEQTAMVLNGSYYTMQIDQTWEGDKRQQWMTIPVPGNQTENLRISEIYAVSQTASDPKAAWEFVKFMTGQEFSRRLIGLGMSSAPIRQSDLTGDNRERLAAFYQNRFEVPSDPSFFSTTTDQAGNALDEAANTIGGPLFKDVIENKRTAGEALAQLKEKLEQEAAAPNKEKAQ